MGIKAKVVTAFKDLETQHIYKVGDVFPANDLEVTEERVEFLSNPHPKTGKIYIFVEKAKEPSVEDVEKVDEPQVEKVQAKPKRGQKKIEKEGE